MPKRPKFDTDAFIEILEDGGVSHARVHAKANKMATEHVYSKTESNLMNAETVQKVFEKFDARTEEMRLESIKLNETVQSIYHKLLGAFVASAIIFGAIISGVELWLHH